jgi:hypothetical protein
MNNTTPIREETNRLASEQADMMVENVLLGDQTLGRFLGWQRLDYPTNQNLLTNLAIRIRTKAGIEVFGVDKSTGKPTRVAA